MSCKVSTTPQPGMLGTMYVGSDRYTVVCAEVKSAKRVKLLEHIPNKYLVNRYKNDNGVEFIPENDLKELIEYMTPNRKNYDNYNNPDELFNWDMKRFNESGNYSLRKNGRWMPMGSSAWETSSVHWGFGDEYMDPSF